jgi:hypothetical protein
MTFVLRQALSSGESAMIPSFFFTYESPSVNEYKVRQDAVLAQHRPRNQLRNRYSTYGVNLPENFAEDSCDSESFFFDARHI